MDDMTRLDLNLRSFSGSIGMKGWPRVGGRLEILSSQYRGHAEEFCVMPSRSVHCLSKLLFYDQVEQYIFV